MKEIDLHGLHEAMRKLEALALVYRHHIQVSNDYDRNLVSWYIIGMLDLIDEASGYFEGAI